MFTDEKGHASKKRLGTNLEGLATELSLVSKLPPYCSKFSVTGNETSGDLEHSCSVVVTSLSSLFKSDGYKMADGVFE